MTSLSPHFCRSRYSAPPTARAAISSRETLIPFAHATIWMRVRAACPPDGGLGEHRSWADMKRYGFISAGGGEFYSKRLYQLSVDDEVFVYDKGNGYIGYLTQRSVDGLSVRASSVGHEEITILVLGQSAGHYEFVEAAVTGD